MAHARLPCFVKCGVCLNRESDPIHASCHCIQCRMHRCTCISLDRFGYSICDYSTICFLQDEDDGLFLARVADYRGQLVVWYSLFAGEYPVWRSGWTVSVSESNRDNWTFMSGFSDMEVTPFVPLKAFRKLKTIVRLLKIARGGFIRLSPLCFCGGREILRLSQAASRFTCLAREFGFRSFADVVMSLA